MYLRSNGFPVNGVDVEDMAPVKQKYAVPADLQACHTGVVEGYVVEGHVPADLIDRLLRERPAVVGIAVPGMPAGSPGMDAPGVSPERYKVFAFERGGRSSVFATR